MWFEFFVEHWVMGSVAVVLGLGGLLAYAGSWVIAENESGLVIKKFGRSLPPGRLHRARGRGRLPGRPVAAGLALRPVGLEVQACRRYRW
jgi:hypothetical protein